MAKRMPKATATGPAAALYKRLQAIGCVLCRTCFAYMPPDHACKGGPWYLDEHESRYVLVGDYGSVRAVERDAEVGYA